MGQQAPRQITLQLLGTCVLLVEGTLMPGVPASFYRIAAYLILSSDALVQQRSRLSSLFWPDADDGKAGANLRQAVARIRHLQEEYGFELIRATSSTLQMVATPDIACDLITLQQHMGGKRPLSPLQMSRTYGGDLLADQGSSSEVFEDWLSAQRNELLLHALDTIAEGIRPGALLSHADRTTCARRLLELDPYREDAVCVLMEEAAQRRHYSRVSELYGAMRNMLAEELGIEPSPETRALYRSLMDPVR